MSVKMLLEVKNNITKEEQNVTKCLRTQKLQLFQQYFNNITSFLMPRDVKGNKKVLLLKGNLFLEK